MKSKQGTAATERALWKSFSGAVLVVFELKMYQFKSHLTTERQKYNFFFIILYYFFDYILLYLPLLSSGFLNKKSKSSSKNSLKNIF